MSERLRERQRELWLADKGMNELLEVQLPLISHREAFI